MIYDSGIWKLDLKKDLQEITDFFKETDLNYDEQFESSDDLSIEERDIKEVAFIKLQKFSIYSSIIIRKLIEANKISDELLRENFAITIYKKISDKKITTWNGYEIETLYDLDNPQKSNISLKDITDYLIHSFHFMLSYDWYKIDESLPDDDCDNWKVNGLLGFYFSSDRSKNTHISYIDLNTYFKIITKAINDNIIQIEYLDGEIVKKSSKVIPIPKYIEEIIKNDNNN